MIEKCYGCERRGAVGNTLFWHRVYDKPGSRIKVALCSKCAANIDSRRVERAKA